MSAVMNKLKSDDVASDLSAQIDTLRADLSTLTSTIADLAAAKGEYAVSSAKAKVNSARDTVADQAETARLHALDLQDQANDFVHKQPGAALGIAAGMGFLVGFMSSRK